MKVILLENVKRIGSVGEVIDVKRGFARNFLIANKKALYASKDYIKNAKKNIEKKQAALAKLEDKVRAMRDKFNEQKLVLDEKVRDQKAEELAYKIKELQRKTEDFQAEVKIADGKFQRDILSVLMKKLISVSQVEKRQAYKSHR